MRILLDCSHVQAGGGLQVSLATLKNAARTSGHEWHAVLSGKLSLDFPPALEAGLTSVTRLGVASRPLAKYWQIARALPGIERRIRPDVVFTVFGPPKWRAQAPQLVGYAIPHLLYPETDVFAGRRGLRATKDRWLLRLNLMWVRHALMKCEFLVVETETVRRRLSKIQQFPASRIFVVRTTYSPFFEESLARSESSTSERPFTILVPSAYYFHKNLEIVPEVAKELLTLTDRAFEFVLIVPEGDRGWQRIRASAESLQVEDRVRTIGAVSHRSIGALYKRSDVVFLPTLLECSTVVYPETFAAGVPLVTSALDFAQELCRDAALYFDPLSPREAALALHRVMTADRSTRARMIAAGRETLKESYPSPEERWEALLACLTAVPSLAARGHGP